MLEQTTTNVDSVPFVHLRVHSEYSLFDSTLTIARLVALAQSNKMPAMALTDFNNLFGFIKFYQKTWKGGIKPIAGCDIKLVDSQQRQWSLCLLVKDEEGYRNLIQIISLAYTEGQILGVPVVKESWLQIHAQGLICLSAAQQGDIAFYLLQEQPEKASERLSWYQQVFGDDFFLEVQRLGKNAEEYYIDAVTDLAVKHQCAVVATNDVRFATKEDFEAHEVRVCISQSDVLDNNQRKRNYTENQYMRSGEEMLALFSDMPQAIANSVEIAKRCNIVKQLGQPCLPKFSVGDGRSEAELLKDEAHLGLQKKLPLLFDPQQADYSEIEQQYKHRLDWELNTIIDMQFPGYFLIVMDFIQWSKNNDIPVGPGRGSGAGSLVAFALDITTLDPIRYDLLFERFLNPERVSMPDFDIDFCIEGRDKVIAYVADKYGKDSVSQIITFGTMAAKAVIKDVARVQQKPYSLADRISKMIPFAPDMTLNKAIEEEPEITSMLENSEEAKEIWDMAKQLEGLARNCGKHAGGVVIAPTQLTDFTPLFSDEDGGNLCSQFDKTDVEEAGLVKFDFLGLRNLTIIAETLKIVNGKQSTDQPDLIIDDINLEDDGVYQLLASGETMAVFQLESLGMKELAQKVKPNRFEDIVALVALYRPGPLGSGMVDDFINRKHGIQKPSYPHPKYQHDCLKPTLEPTYGIILYQEQVMQIAQVMGGYSLGTADLLRRAMGKKKPEEMAKQREIFIQGAHEQGHNEELAGPIFSLMEEFAGYGFNKSHSAAYALISYQTAWLKYHYPAPFMVSVLSSFMTATPKLVALISECRRMNLKVNSPSVNHSQYRFSIAINDEAAVHYGLGAVKGVGEAAVESIVQERQNNGSYFDLFDFCNRVDIYRVNKRVLEALIWSGAMDELIATTISKDNEHLNRDRAILMAALPDAIKGSEQARENKDSGMQDLFGSMMVATESNDSKADVYSRYRRAEVLNSLERLMLERQTLGLYLTGHPITGYLEELSGLTNSRLANIELSANTQILAGWLVEVRRRQTKKGKPMALISIDDQSGRIEVPLFSEVLESCQEYLKTDTVVLLECQVLKQYRSENDEGEEEAYRINCKKVTSLEAHRMAQLKSIHIDINKVEHNNLQKLTRSLELFKGDSCKVVFTYNTNDERVDLALQWKVNPQQALFDKIKHCCGNSAMSYRFN